MNVSKEEILHIAKLANLNLKEEEIDTYILHLQDILVHIPNFYSCYIMLKVVATRAMAWNLIPAENCGVVKHSYTI